MARPLIIGFFLATNTVDVHWHKPLSFGYLKSYLEKFSRYPTEMEFLTEIEQIDRCDIVCVSSTSQNFPRAIEIAQIARSRNFAALTVIGGQHISCLPESLPQDFDVGVIGEGEAIFLEIVNGYAECGCKLEELRLSLIDGIVYHDHAQLKVTRRRELIEPLDSLPIPYRFPNETPYLFTSRGCPYHCSFCSSSAFWSKTRFFGADYVVEEICSIIKQFPDLNCINIWDDLFLADRPRFDKIVAMIEQKGIAKNVGFSFSVRANLVNDDICRALKRMNVIAVAFGAESGSDRILDLLGKGTTVETNQRAIDTLHHHGIKTQCSFIVGVPTETQEEVRSTYEFILRNVASGKISPRCPVNILMPIPGTPMWDYAVQNGLVRAEGMDWGRLAVFAAYQDSSVQDFNAWVEQRRANRSIYLAEDSLPQDRLYELMSVYGQAISAFDERTRLSDEYGALRNSLGGRAVALLNSMVVKLRGMTHV